MAMMGYREYGRHRKVSLRAVQKAITDGRIRTVDINGRRMIDAVEADRDWIVNTDPAKQSLLHELPAAPATIGVQPSAQEDEAPAAADEIDENTREYRAHRAKREKIATERAQLELDEMRGRLVDVSQVAQAGFTAFRSLRDGILNVPVRIKDALAAETDAFRCEQIVEAALSEVLAKFDGRSIVRDVDDEDDD